MGLAGAVLSPYAVNNLYLYADSVLGIKLVKAVSEPCPVDSIKM